MRLEKLPVGELNYRDFVCYLQNIPSDSQLAKVIEIRTTPEKDLEYLSDAQKEMRQKWIDKWTVKTNKQESTKTKETALMSALFGK